jgi:hypothetical protein
MPTFAQTAGATDERGVNRGFLGSEATYAYVRDLAPLSDRARRCNFGGPKALRAVGDWLRVARPR